MIKIGLLGAGSVGQSHVRALLQLSDVEIVGVYDPDKQLAKQFCENFKLNYFNDPLSLILLCDGMDIVSSLLSQTYFATLAIKNSKHVFLEQPFRSQLKEIESLMKLAGEANVKVQLGFSERFNPAFQAALAYINRPMYLELTRKISFNSTSGTIPVVTDIMLGDIDLVLSLIKANIKKVHATGVNVFGKSPDIVNAHLEFDNGAVASLTASRMATRPMREIDVYQPLALIHIDLLKQESSLISNSMKTPEHLRVVQNSDVKNDDKIATALESFIHAVNQHAEPWIKLTDGYHALKIASMITDKIRLVNNTI